MRKVKIKKSFKGIEIIWQYLKPYKKRVYFIASMAIIGAIIGAFIPYLYGRLVDAAINVSAPIKFIAEIIILWLVLALVGDWIDRVVSFEGYELAIMLKYDCVTILSGHVLNLPMNFHKTKKMGEIINRIQRAGEGLDEIIGDVLFNLIPSFLTVSGALVVMTIVEWKLAVTLILILLLHSIASVWKINPIVVNQKKLNKVYEKVWGDVYDSVGNAQIVKSFTREKFERKKIIKNFKITLSDRVFKHLNYWRDLNFWQSTIFSLGYVLIFTGAIYLLRMGQITVGQLVMFVGYVSLAYMPFGRLANNYKRIKTASTAIERGEALKKEKTEPYDDKKRKILEDVKGEVEFQSVYFSYSKKQGVLKDINFKAKPGEMIALVGESGVGKSTLIDLISGYYRPTKGQILIDGQNVNEINLQSLRKYIAIVPQEVSLFNDTVKNNIRYGNPKATEEEIIIATKAAHAHRFIQKFPKKYKQLVGERGIKLSTGQKQRVAIARALLRNPKILILDEATASLDSATEKLVQDALNHLIKGRTTFVIAHRLSTIQEADQILVLEKGKIIEEGDHQELIEKGGVYKKLSELQSTILRG